MNTPYLPYSVRFGLISGLLFAALTFIFWTFDIHTYVKFLTLYTWIPAIFITILVGGFMFRKGVGGYLTFQEGLKYAFLAFVIYELIYALVTYLLYNILDPELTMRVFDIVSDQTRSMMEKFGANEEQIEDAMQKAKEQAKETTIKQVILGLGMGLVYSFVKGCIIAVIIKKKKPEFESNVDGFLK